MYTITCREVDVDRTIEQAKALHQAGRLAEAEALYRQALAAQPDHAEATHFLGMLLGNIQLLRRSVELRPDVAHYHNNLGEALRKSGRIDEALAAYGRAIQLRPGYAIAHYNMGVTLAAAGRADEAIEQYRRAIAIKTDFVQAYDNLGSLLTNRNRLDDATECYQRAMELAPSQATLHFNHGNLLKEQGYLDRAIKEYRRAVALDPALVSAHSSLCYFLYFAEGIGPAQILAEHREWNRRHAAGLAREIQPHRNDRNPDRKLRICYVSPDFRQHPVGAHLLTVLEAHDHAQVEVFCYCDTTKKDWVTEKCNALADRWRETRGLSDEQLAQVVRDDGIDILIDCALHMANNRLLVFARKPAPVQVTWFGYPGTTGLNAIDDRITDVHLDPPGEHDEFYSEKSVRLPDSFWCYRPLVETPEPSERSAGPITFGCLNNFAKIGDGIARLWAQILNRVPQSRLVLLAEAGSHLRRISDIVGSDRVEFVGFRPIERYLKLYEQIDITLDSFPYNGHTTSLDSLYMGVPVVTLIGQTVVSRAGLSILTNLGLPELVARTPERYVEIAVALANDRGRIGELRRTLRQRMCESPLMNARQMTRNLETEFRQMWLEWCVESG